MSKAFKIFHLYLYVFFICIIFTFLPHTRRKAILFDTNNFLRPFYNNILIRLTVSKISLQIIIISIEKISLYIWTNSYHLKIKLSRNWEEKTIMHDKIFGSFKKILKNKRNVCSKRRILCLVLPVCSRLYWHEPKQKTIIVHELRP